MNLPWVCTSLGAEKVFFFKTRETIWQEEIDKSLIHIIPTSSLGKEQGKESSSVLLSVGEIK